MKYVAIVEEVLVHRIEFDAKSDEDAEVIAFEGFRDGIMFDDDPHRDAITILSIDTKEEHDGVTNGDT